MDTTMAPLIAKKPQSTYPYRQRKPIQSMMSRTCQPHNKLTTKPKPRSTKDPRFFLTLRIQNSNTRRLKSLHNSSSQHIQGSGSMLTPSVNIFSPTHLLESPKVYTIVTCSYLLFPKVIDCRILQTNSCQETFLQPFFDLGTFFTPIHLHQ